MLLVVVIYALLSSARQFLMLVVVFYALLCLKACIVNIIVQLEFY